MNPTSNDIAVEVRALRRVFARGLKEKVALNNVSFSVRSGKIHGLLGPNGAGKTTLMKILSTVLLPTSGSVRLVGYDIVDQRTEVRRKIGVVFGGDNGLYDRVGSRENLLFWGALSGVPRRVLTARIERLINMVGIQDVADVPVQAFSRGMKQRLHLARGLVNNPALLLLDEPTLGMDPGSSLEFRRLVRDIAARGQTMLMSTHDMEEATELCDGVTMIDHGNIIDEPDLNHVLTQSSKHNVLQLPVLEPSEVERVVRLFTEVDATVTILPSHGMNGARLIFGSLDQARRSEALFNQQAMGTATIERLTLKDVYLRAVGARGFQV